MPLSDNVVGAMLTEEYARFTQGFRSLSPDAHVAFRIAAGGRGADPTKPRTITVPGWDDVIKLGEKHHSTATERATFYAERRAGKASSLSGEAQALIARERAQIDARRQSAAPETNEPWAAILTAVDNVQDFISTMATAGRLAIWAAPRIPAALGIETTAVGAALGRVGLRAGMRLVPVVGTVLLVSDLLNLLNYAGMAASPVYGLLCSGAQRSLATAAPMLVFKRGLKQEIWKKTHTNPFGRRARLARASKALSGRIGIPELLEVAQTTEQLFGYGVSLGAIMGATTEAAAAAVDALEGRPTSVNVKPLRTVESEAVARHFAEKDPLTRMLIRQAGAIAATAPSVMRLQDHFTDEEHLEVMLGYLAAQAILRDVWRGVDADALVGRLHDVVIRPPVLLHESTVDHLRYMGADPEDGRKWWFDGFPRTATVGRVMDDAIVSVPQGVRDFILPRRNQAEGVFYGALVSQLTEHLFRWWFDDAEALTWELAPDYALLASLAESGYLAPHNNRPRALWRFWQHARRELAARDARSLDACTWERLAEAHGVTLLRMLPPLSPWPRPD